MRLLRRNTTEFEYYKYAGLKSDLNEDELHTGIPEPKYESPVTYRGTISTPSGNVAIALDGAEIRYTHVLVMDKPDVDISETGYIIWKDRKYDVTAVRPSLNSVTIALHQRVEDFGDQAEGDN